MSAPAIAVGDKIAFRLIEGTALWQGEGRVTAVHDDGSIDLEWKDSHMTNWQYLINRRERVPRTRSLDTFSGGTLAACRDTIEHVNWERVL